MRAVATAEGTSAAEMAEELVAASGAALVAEPVAASGAASAAVRVEASGAGSEAVTGAALVAVRVEASGCGWGPRGRHSRIHYLRRDKRPERTWTRSSPPRRTSTRQRCFGNRNNRRQPISGYGSRSAAASAGVASDRNRRNRLARRRTTSTRTRYCRTPCPGPPRRPRTSRGPGRTSARSRTSRTST